MLISVSNCDSSINAQYDEEEKEVAYLDKVSGSTFLIGTVFEEKHMVKCQGQDGKQCTQREFTSEVDLQRSVDSENCFKLKLFPKNIGLQPGICFDVKSGFWYGGSELQHQRWPFKDLTLPWQPYVSNDIVPLNESVGNVLERYWLSSNGVGIYVHESSPTYFKHIRKTTENGQTRFAEMCFLSKHSVNAYGFVSDINPLEIEVCKTANILETHKLMSVRFFDKPMGIPDERMFKSPIWSTWAKFKVDIDQEKVKQYADEIIDHGFSNSQIEIDDMFSTYYGEFDFTPKKFNDPKGMVDALKTKGFRVTVWVTPFANTDAPVFLEGAARSFWLTDVDGRTPALVKWWQGVGATLDVDNAAAVEW